MITLRGEAGQVVRAAFDDFEVRVEPSTTVLRGYLADQAALHGVLERIRSLGIEIVEVRREEPGDLNTGARR